MMQDMEPELIVGIIGVLVTVGTAPVFHGLLRELAARSLVSPQQLRYGLAAVAFGLLGTLPEWATKTSLLPTPPDQLGDAIAMCLNFTALAALVLVVVLSAGRRSATKTVHVPPGARGSGRDTMATLVAVGLLLSYVVIVVQGFGMTRVWAQNRDTLFLWLILLVANALILSPHWSRARRAALLLIGGAAAATAGWNLWHLFSSEAGVVTWALKTGVLQGMYLCIASGLMLFALAIPSQASQRPQDPDAGPASRRTGPQ